MIFIDTETCGLHGVPVLIQYAENDGPVVLHDIWTTPMEETIALIDWFLTEDLVFYNATFDWFHLVKIYSMLNLVFYDGDTPMEHLQELAEREAEARDGFCLKPKGVLDLMLEARKGKYQNTMNRSPIRVRRIPIQMGDLLAEELNNRVPLNPLFFARSKKGIQWHVLPIEDDLNFCDVCLIFSPSTSLKALAADLLGKKATKFEEISLDRQFSPKELGYAPFAAAGYKPKDKPFVNIKVEEMTTDWKETWPSKLYYHVEHWSYNPQARKYAEDDIINTRGVYYGLNCPEFNDDDSVLACMVAMVRWKGFAVNETMLDKVIAKYTKLAASCPFKDSSQKVQMYLKDAMLPVEAEYVKVDKIDTPKTGDALSEFERDPADLLIDNSSKQLLMKIMEWGDHPAAERAREVFTARDANYKVKMLNKIKRAGRFHASFKVIGTKSSRMSGTDGLNAQGIVGTDEIRSIFSLAFDGEKASIGDFCAFEVTLMEATYKDPQLRESLLAGKKIHALFGMELFPGHTYEEICASEHTENDMYKKGKSGIFAMGYGGSEYTLETRLGVSAEVADRAYHSFARKYPGIGEARQRIIDKFCTMSQEGGLGTAVVWKDPDDYIESMMGFRRYFSLENKICKALFDLAENPPKDWYKLRIKVTRRDRQQTATGAVRSALFGAAFGIQASVMRAAANHEIQSPGAQITKNLQCDIWALQPHGVHPWRVRPMNVHDEVAVVHSPEVEIKPVIDNCVEKFKSKVPLIAIDWKSNVKSWAEK